MDSQTNSPVRTPSTRHKCSACFKQYKRKEHLVEHMRVAYHSVHEPKCGVCKKHCKSYESVREHLTGPLPKVDCAKIYSTQGCGFCLNIFGSSEARDAHKRMCQLSPAVPHEFSSMPLVENSGPPEMEMLHLTLEGEENQIPEAVALDCEMVGGGSDGSLDLCGRVCIIDEAENVIFHSYVTPQIPVTDYRFEITGMTEDDFKEAMPLKQVQAKVQEILYNGESIWKLRMEGGRARILVGHDLEHDLCCLRMNYPNHLMRDTAQYRPLMKTNLISHSLKYLTQTYLGYEIQSGVHNPYEDCVATMRLYKRMRAQVHPPEAIMKPIGPHLSNSFDAWKSKELESMSPDELLEISRSNYRCWCLDSRQTLNS